MKPSDLTPLPTLSIVVPRLAVANSKLPRFQEGSPYDVHDGKGHAVQSANSHFRDLLRTVHEAYKGTHKWCEKRSIAKSVFMSVTRKGGRFLDANGEPKSETDAMKKIMKSLKDLPLRPTLKPRKEVLDTLPRIHYVSGADFAVVNEAVPDANGLSTSSSESVDRDNHNTPVVPSLMEATPLPLKFSPLDGVDSGESTQMLNSVVPSEIPRGPLSESATSMKIGGGRCHMESINSIATFDAADFDLQEERQWFQSSQTSSADRFRWSTPKSSGCASAAARTNLQNSLFGMSGRLSNELDLFQEGQISLEKFLGLGNHATVPSLWQQVSL
jgi:hypothetical protein